MADSREAVSEPGHRIVAPDPFSLVYRDRDMLSPLADFSLAVAAPVAGVVACLVLYMAYKMLYRPDFGTPVRRRLLIRGIRVRRDQLAEVPIWWSNLQVQRAMRAHWKETLRRNALPHGR